MKQVIFLCRGCGKPQDVNTGVQTTSGHYCQACYKKSN